jgi:DNA-binding transcriptional regulator YiaG
MGAGSQSKVVNTCYCWVFSNCILIETGNDMTTLLTRPHETKWGSEARRLRISLHIAQPELAIMANVSLETLNLFEHNQPVPLDSRRRILKELWAEKSKK